MILLPVATRYEQEGGGTETTTERRIAFSPEIPRQVGEARSEWRLFADVAARVRPDLRPRVRLARQPGAAGRDRRGGARSTPASSTWRDTGDAVQWGGRHLCAGGVFPTPDGRARFSPLDPGRAERARRACSRWPPGGASSSTRWCWKATDPLTGAGRDAVYIDEADAAALGLAEGDRGACCAARPATMDGPRQAASACPARTLQVHWPEGNVLLAAGPSHREPGSQVPDYNALATIEVPAPDPRRTA